ncbi:MAG: hypothetical protein J6C42_00620 [Clostridia bacterium]|nr:hypothetical protein [Clostridia bacterium]
MKRKYKISTGKETIEREYNYIPVRYIIAVLITLFEILAIISIVVACCYYLCTDTANFATLVLNFTQNAVEQNCRDAKSLANLALIFFSSREVADLLDKSNPAECAEGVTMRPRATIVPAIPFDANMPDAVEIKKRIYYGRLMDFFIADFFDALACGHYLWQCKYCGRYFLMTTGHRQL